MDTLGIDVKSDLMQRSSDIRADAVFIRDLSLTQASLFLLSTTALLLWSLRLSTTLRDKTDYFNEVSHDLRLRVHGVKLAATPLSSLPMTEGGVADSSSPERLAKVRAMAADLQSYLDNFLDLARMDAVGLRVQWGIVNLQDLFQQLESQFDLSAKVQHVELSFRQTSLRCRADHDLLHRLLDNLLANALQHTRGRVRVSARRCAGRIEISVLDDGPGMSDPQRQSLMTHFARGPVAHPSTPPAVGTPQTTRRVGLGLAMVSRSAQAMDATIKVRTRPGRGTIFSVMVMPEPPASASSA